MPASPTARLVLPILLGVALIACGGKAKTSAGVSGQADSASKPAPPKDHRKPLTAPADLRGLSYEIFQGGKKVAKIEADSNQVFPMRYNGIAGVTTFRGDAFRSAPSYGVARIREKKLKKVWQASTGVSGGRWGGGAGWTGQPAIVQWPSGLRSKMNLKEPYRRTNGFTEVIQASLAGNVYFWDLATGKPTRDPIRIGNPIKGSVAVHPNGIPMLYVGDGIREKAQPGFRLFSLVDQKLLHFFPTDDGAAFRRWPGNDCSALFNSAADTMVVASENGLLHRIELGTKWNPATGQLSVKPKQVKFRYKSKTTREQGIENSVAIYKNFAYFTNNGGDLVCLDLTTMQPVWNRDVQDDSDASCVIDVEAEDRWAVYTGCEVDKQGSKGWCYVRKFDGRTGKPLWTNQYRCLTILGAHPVNGGLLATPIVGKNRASDRVVFSLARYERMNAGLLVALDKKTGKEIWRYPLANYAWSSPVDFYDAEGRMYIVQCTSAGEMKLIDGETGRLLHELNFGANIEASPAIFGDMLVVAARGTQIYGVRIL
ncbi:MAG TPA: PQQ-binding-like beta-propeller repeat protein [Fimbriimonadaceae bacterium]|nr:PQQ-binding-like beta-propeller repeat protein [Fimbriimonadaceae bacterium]HRJ97718.1 PQQ-binding-like beta-propeller repeat protein [Fimbriimonadaceae bacterium]